MDYRVMFHKCNLPDCWVFLPPAQAIATESDALMAQKIEAMRKAHEEAVANKKKMTTN